MILVWKTTSLPSSTATPVRAAGAGQQRGAPFSKHAFRGKQQVGSRVLHCVHMGAGASSARCRGRGVWAGMDDGEAGVGGTSPAFAHRTAESQVLAIPRA
jgi:hypothetical protein